MLAAIFSKSRSASGVSFLMRMLSALGIGAWYIPATSLSKLSVHIGMAAGFGLATVVTAVCLGRFPARMSRMVCTFCLMPG